jgi:hypothetical protein
VLYMGMMLNVRTKPDKGAEINRGDDCVLCRVLVVHVRCITVSWAGINSGFSHVTARFATTERANFMLNASINIASVMNASNVNATNVTLGVGINGGVTHVN